MIAIVDYGVGNLFSLLCSLKAIGAQAVVTGDQEKICEADRIILPGVGAFEDAIGKLRETKLDQVLIAECAMGKPLLGICLGMQLLFETSEEYGHHQGLGLIKGDIRYLGDQLDASFKIPHMGWNKLELKKDHPLFRYNKSGDYVYFVHSYAAFDCEDSLLASCEYGIEVTAAVAKKNVMGTQFHPEKSGAVGLKMLKAFNELNKEDLC